MQPPVINTMSGATEAQANPAATHTRESNFSCNVNYLTSGPGILKLLELSFGLFAWALFAAGYSVIGAHQFVLFVTITAWLTTLILLMLFSCGCHANACEGVPFSIIEFCHNLFWALFYLIAACVAAGSVNIAFLRPQFVGGTVFAFFVTIFYIIHTFTSFKEWRGAYPWS